MPFTHLVKSLAQATRPEDKTSPMVTYFQAAPHSDAAWALHLLLGKRVQRTLSPTQLKLWSGQAGGVPQWLTDESFDHVGDAAEAAALLVPQPQPPAPGSPEQSPLTSLSLTDLIENHLPGLLKLPQESLQAQLTQTWLTSTVPQRIVYNRLLLGGAGFKVPPSLIARTLAKGFGLSHAQMATRLSSDWSPTPQSFARLIQPDSPTSTTPPRDAGHAYPFQVAQEHPLHLLTPTPPDLSLFTRDPNPETRNPSLLWADSSSTRDPGHGTRDSSSSTQDAGHRTLDNSSSSTRDTGHGTRDSAFPSSLPSYRAQWLYNGVRIQLIKRHARWLLWSTASQPITGSFPELASLAHALPDGSVIDAIILAWDNGPKHISKLLPRLQENQTQLQLWEDTPIMLIAIDLLEENGQDIRPLPLSQRLLKLSNLITPLTSHHPIRLADAWPADPWLATQTLLHQSRSLMHRGIVLKHLDSPYAPAPPSSSTSTPPQSPAWLSIKADPLLADLVLTASEPGGGRLHTRHTLSAWSISSSCERTLVPITKADTGLCDEDQKRIDQFVRANVTGKFGPVKTVTPQLVVQVAFDDIHEAPRHKSGLTLINPVLRSIKAAASPATAASIESLHLLTSR
jgi:DNA ligase 1